MTAFVCESGHWRSRVANDLLQVIEEPFIGSQSDEVSRYQIKKAPTIGDAFDSAE